MAGMPAPTLNIVLMCRQLVFRQGALLYIAALTDSRLGVLSWKPTRYVVHAQAQT